MKNILYFFIAIILFSAYQSSAKIYRLGFPGKAVNNVDFQYVNSQAMIALANSGDTIQVYNTLAFSGLGNSSEALTLSNSILQVDKPLVFIGYGFDLNDNTGYQYVNKSAEKYLPFSFTSGSAGSIVSGIYGKFEIAESNISVLNCQVKYLEIATGSGALFLDDITIKGCNFADPRLPEETGGIRISVPFSFGVPGADIANLKILNNYIGYIQFDQHNFYEDPTDPLMSYSQNGSGIIANNIFANQTNNPNQFNVDVFGTFEIKNNIVLDPTYDAACFFTSQFDPFYNPFGGSAVVRNNLFVGLSQGSCSDYTTANLDNLLGTNVLRNFNPNFIAKDSNLLLSTGSLAINAGKNNANANTNCGVFGGEVGDAYRFSGIPNIPAIYVLHTATNQPVGTSAIFTVSTRSNNSSNINKLEYYIDTDPGFAVATNIPITAATNISNTTFTVALAALAPGMHNLVIRSRDALGNWSLNNIYPFVKAYNTVPAPALSRLNKIEYYVDTDPGIGSATNVVITNDTAKINQAIAVNMAGLANGNHKVFVRSRDSLGRWSLSNFKTVNYTATAAAKPNLGPDQTVTKCIDQTFNLATLANIAGVTNQYFNATFVAITNQTTVQNGVYQIIGTATSGGLKDTVQITVNNLPKPNLGTDQTIQNCTGVAYNLTQSFTAAGITYTYFNSTFVAVANPNGVNNGLFNVVGTNTNGCKDTVQVTITSGTKPNLGFDQNWGICPGTPYNLSAPFTTPGLTYQYFSSTYASISTPSAAGLGTYNVVATNTSGCKDTVQYVITLLGGVTLGADQTFSKVTTATFNLTTDFSGYNMTYYNANFTQIITTPSAVDTGMYQLIASNGNCTDTAKITVVNSGTKPNLGPNQTVSKCVEATVNLVPLVTLSGVTFQYYNSTYAAITNQTTVQNGVYQIIGTATIGGLKDTVQITVNNFPKPNLGVDTTVRVCPSFTFNLNTLFTNTALTYTYYNNSSTIITTQAVAPVGVYSVIGTNNNGCKDTVIVVVSTNPKPNLGIDITGSVCAGTTTVIGPVSAPSGSTLTYFTNTFAPLSTNTVGVGVYNIIATNNIFGCQDTMVYTVVNYPVVNLGPDQVVNINCSSTTYNLTSLATVSSYNYLYYTSSYATLSNPTMAPAGTYFISGNIGGNSGACRDTFMVTINPSTKPNLGGDLTINGCGNTYNLTNQANISGLAYTYFTNTFASITNQTAVSAGVYQMIGTNNSGCSDTLQLTVNVTKPNLGPDQSTVICANTTFNLAALATNTALTYTYFNSTFGSTTTNVSPGIYYIIGTSAVFCTDTLKQTVFSTLSLGPDTTVYKNSSSTFNLVALHAGTGYTRTYVNNTFPFATVANPSSVGVGSYVIYSVDPITTCKDTIIVTVANTVGTKPNLGVDQIISKCVENTVNLVPMVNVIGVTNQYFNATFVPITNQTAVQNGMYQIIGTATVGGLKDTVIITVNNYAKPSAGPDTTVAICPGTTFDLSVFDNSTASWNSYDNLFNVVNNYSTVSTGIYYNIGINANSCTDTIKITIITAPKPALQDTFLLNSCTSILTSTNFNVLFNAFYGTTALNYSYFTLPTYAIFNPATGFPAGSYGVIATNTNGCSDSSIFTNNFVPKPNLGVDQNITKATSATVNLTTLYTGFTFTYFTNTFVALTTPTAVDTGMYQIIATNIAFCKDTVKITVSNNATAVKPNLGADQTVSKCVEQTVNLVPLVNVSGVTYQYFNATYVPITNQTAVQNGMYQIIGTATAGGLKDTVKITVNNYAKPNAGLDQTFNTCGIGTSNLTTLAYTISLSFQYLNSNFTTVTTPTAVATGNYYFLAIQNSTGCKDTAQVSVISTPLNLGPDLLKTYLGPSGYDLATALTSAGTTFSYFKSSWFPLGTSTNVLLGIYYIVGDKGGCKDTVQVTVKLGKGRSTTVNTFESVASNDVIIYPNPVVSNFSIDLVANSDEKLILSVLDIQGKILKTQVLQTLKGTNRFEIDIESLSTGIYIVRLANENGTYKVFKIDKL
jgi:hypothetical protein